MGNAIVYISVNWMRPLVTGTIIQMELAMSKSPPQTTRPALHASFIEPPTSFTAYVATATRQKIPAVKECIIYESCQHGKDTCIHRMLYIGRVVTKDYRYY